MDAQTLDALKKQNDESPLHAAILDHAKRLVKMSRAKMSQNYNDWDIHDRVYRGEAIPDEEDRVNEQKGKPSKMIVPNTFAQTMTFTSFLFLLFTQNNRFYSLNPNAADDFGYPVDDCEAVLERDVRHNEFNTKLFQHLLDIGRFGLAPLDVSWTRDYTWANVPQPASSFTFGGVTTQLAPAGNAFQKFTKFEGNLIRPISPYRFFPDTRFPISEMHRGEFVAYDEEFTVGELRKLESQGEVAGIDHIGPLPRNIKQELGGDIVGTIRDWEEKDISAFDVNNRSSIALVTKCQIKIVPAQFKYDATERKPLGPEDFPIIYHVWIANHNRIIRFEPCGYWHGEFSVSCAQFTPDMHRTVTGGLSELIYELQKVISWYINAHVKSVTRVIGNRLIVNPAIIDTKTLDGEGDIYVRKGVSPPSLDRVVGQLRAQDVTGGHMQDAEMLSRIIETVTGVNGNAMGQYNGGRRSAQESRVVTAGAAGRMKMHAQLIWEASLGRTGRLALSNLRQDLSWDSFSRIVSGPQRDPQTEELLRQRYAAFQGTPEEIISGDDYLMFDSTLSSEKGFMAQSLQELLSIILSNPQVATQLDISPKGMLEEIQLLRGAGDVNRFSLSKRIASGKDQPPQPSPEEQMAMMQQQQQMLQGGGGEGGAGGGPAITHNPKQSTSTTIAPVVHIHHAKPTHKAKAK